MVGYRSELISATSEVKNGNGKQNPSKPLKPKPKTQWHFQKMMIGKEGREEGRAIMEAQVTTDRTKRINRYIGINLKVKWHNLKGESGCDRAPIILKVYPSFPSREGKGGLVESQKVHN